MNDTERAIDLLNRWHADNDAGMLADWVAEEFAAVRLDERRACLLAAEDVHDLYRRSQGHAYVAHQIAERIRLRGAGEVWRGGHLADGAAGAGT